MKLKVISTATSKKGNVFVNTMKTEGEMPVLDTEVACKTREEVNSFLQEIKHGDEQHQRWLADKVSTFFGWGIDP